MASQDMSKALPLLLAALAGAGLGLLGATQLRQVKSKKLRSGKMKVLLFGAGGWIGGQILATLEAKGIEVVASTSGPGKETDDKVADELDRVQPTHVVSCIGRTHGGGINTIDYLEGGPDKLVFNVRDNLYGPLLIARLCETRNIHYTYYGTGCIFKYEGDHQPGQVGKTEEDLPNFFGSSYSVVKGFTDRLMHHWGDNVLNLRIRMPVTNRENKRNFITKVAAYERVVNVPNGMSYLPEMFEHMVDLMHQGKTGTLNYCNPGVISHVEVLTMFKDQCDPNHKLNVMSLDEQRAILAADRSNTFLDATKLKEWCPTVMPIQEAMKVAMDGLSEDMKANANKK